MRDGFSIRKNAMESHIIIVSLAALLMGVSLGVFGAGGSILTVPILVYLQNIPPTLATHYSLFVVGAVSAFGVLLSLRAKQIQFQKSLGFALPAILGMIVAKKILLPAIPVEFSLWEKTIHKDSLILFTFALFMAAASLSMLFIKVKENEKTVSAPSLTVALTLAVIGLGVGIATGFVGAGGGFLIIPALVFLAHYPIKEASATSLFIIMLNSATGFVFGTPDWSQIPWASLVLGILLFALVGMWLGLVLQKKIQADRLKPAFGVFVLLMGIYIFFHL